MQVEKALMDALQVTFVVGLIFYAFTLVIFGPKAGSRVLGVACRGTGGLVIYLVRLIIMTAINTLVLAVRLAASLGRQGAAVEAISHYVERMADLLMGA